MRQNSFIFKPHLDIVWRAVSQITAGPALKDTTNHKNIKGGQGLRHKTTPLSP